MSPVIGHCNCGTITVTVADGLPDSAVLCSCTSCRRSGGTVATVNAVVNDGAFSVTGTPKQYTTKGTSGLDVTRNFCGDCGSPIFTTTLAAPGVNYLKLGLFEVGQMPKPAAHLFSKNAEEWQPAVEGAHKLETQ